MRAAKGGANPSRTRENTQRDLFKGFLRKRKETLRERGRGPLQQAPRVKKKEGSLVGKQIPTLEYAGKEKKTPGRKGGANFGKKVMCRRTKKSGRMM